MRYRQSELNVLIDAAVENVVCAIFLTIEYVYVRTLLSVHDMMWWSVKRPE